jgi:hypothetical protein
MAGRVTEGLKETLHLADNALSTVGRGVDKTSTIRPLDRGFSVPYKRIKLRKRAYCALSASKPDVHFKIQTIQLTEVAK